MNMPIRAGHGVAMDQWMRFLDDLDACASSPQILENQGKLVRVAGLVLEATGLRLPVGAVCEIHSETRLESTPVLAEVVGFTGDRAFLMPTAEVHGLSSGARVVPRSLQVNPPVLGRPNHPWRRSEDRTRHLPIGSGLLGRVVDAQGVPMDRKGPLDHVRSEPLARRPMTPLRTITSTAALALLLIAAGAWELGRLNGMSAPVSWAMGLGCTAACGLAWCWRWAVWLRPPCSRCWSVPWRALAPGAFLPWKPMSAWACAC